MSGVDVGARIRSLLPALLVSGAALAAHHPILSNGFIHLDDQPYVTGNPDVLRGLGLEGARWAFTNVHSYTWHPITTLSHMADVSMWGVNPAGHHLGNWLLHALNATLVLVVLRRATGASWRAAAVALLFAVHPVHVESVAWVSERKDTLSTLFLLWALAVYVGPEGKPSARGRAWAVVLVALGLLSKPMVVMAPMLMLLLDAGPLRRLDVGGRGLARPWSVVVEKWPFFALSAAAALVTVVSQHRGGQGAVVHESPLWINAGNAVVAYARYLGLLAWPVDLALVYPFRSDAITWPAVLGALAVLFAITWAAFRLRASRPYLLLGWLWYLAAMLPVAGFLRFGYQAHADRYLYVPALGLYAAVVWAAADLGSRVERSRRGAVLVAGLGIAVAILGFLTFEQARRWRSSVTLFEHTLSVEPENPLVLRALGNAYAELGRLDLAFERKRRGRLLEAEEVVRLNPGAAEAHHLLGAALAEHGRDLEAVEAFRRALALDGSRAQTCNSLGLVLARSGREVEAREAFREAVRLAPGDPQFRHNLEVMERAAPAAAAGGAR